MITKLVALPMPTLKFWNVQSSISVFSPNVLMPAVVRLGYAGAVHPVVIAIEGDPSDLDVLDVHRPVATRSNRLQDAVLQPVGRIGWAGIHVVGQLQHRLAGAGELHAILLGRRPPERDRGLIEGRHRRRPDGVDAVRELAGIRGRDAGVDRRGAIHPAVGDGSVALWSAHVIWSSGECVPPGRQQHSV
jgi:hypothetical protein